jgi:uncharacterized protein YfaS (alpha-2-macroglobulin family)
MRQKRILYALFAVVVIASLLFAGRAFWPVSAPQGTPTPQATPPPGSNQPNLPQDVVAPLIIGRTPAGGEELLPDGAVELVFARPMDRASVESAFSLVNYPGGSPAVAGQFQWRDERSVRFVPAKPLARAAVYRARLEANARDAAGNEVGDPSTFSVRVVGYLEVAQVLPANDTRDVDPAGAITVIFNRPVVPLTTLEQQQTLPQPLVFEPAVAGRGEWLNTAIYRFTPEQPLQGGTTYSARVEAGLVDTVGTPLQAGYQWRFSTAPPAVAWTEPGRDAEQIAPDTAITVTFNQPIDAASAAAAFSLRTGVFGMDRIQGTYVVSGTQLTFRPAARLNFGATYTAEVGAGVRAAGGGIGMPQAYSWTFETSPLPRIESTDPRDGARDVYPYTGFTIKFSAPIRPETVEPNLTWTPALSPTQVYTYYSPYDNTFTIQFGAQPSSDYRVVIGPDIADRFGNKTGQTWDVSFRTGDLDPAAQILVPDIVGTYNGYDPARLVVAHLNVSRLELRLARLDAAQLTRAYEYGWGANDLPPGEERRRWTLDAVAERNKTAYTRVDLVAGGATLEPGMYLLELNAPELKGDYLYGRRHVLVVSTINLTLKREPDAVYVWATDLRSGAPVAGLALELRESYGHRLHGSAVTNAQGVARFALSADARDDGLYVLNAAGESRFTAVSDSWSNGISSWEFNLPGGYGLEPYRLHLLTDRPLYRPGQRVYFRGVLRAADDTRYSLPSGIREVSVRVTGPDGGEVFNGELPLGPFGTFNGGLDLPAGAALGGYNISASFRDPARGEQAAGASFTVAAYRPPEFSVTVTPANGDVVSGTHTTALVGVAYFFGGPVAGRDVSWNVTAQPYYFDLPGAGGYSWSDGDDPYIFMWGRGCGPYADCPGGFGGQVILSGSGRTDAQGQIAIDLPADLLARNKLAGSQVLMIEASVSGADGQVISGRASVNVHQAEHYVGVRPSSYVVRAGEETLAELLVVGWNGARRPGVTVELEIVQSEWINTFVENPGGQGGSWTYERKDTVVASVTVVTDANGEAGAPVTPPAGGSYRLRARAADAAGRHAISSAFLWVTGDEVISWRQDSSDRITLISDRTRYRPGDVAEILVPSPFQGRQYAWVTVERGHLMQEEVIAFEGSTLVYRLPITAEHAPNVFVSVVLMKGQDESNRFAAHKIGYAALEVETSAQALTVELRPRAGTLEPGQQAVFDLIVRDGAGRPVQAELSLDLVDKAVLSLLPRGANAILQTFYGPRALEVRTAGGLTLSVNRLVELQLEQQTADQRSAGGTGGEPPAMPAAQPTMVAEAAAGQDKMADGSGYAAPPGVDIRAEFADTAYWNAALVTDANGQATVEIILPDNLTTWVLRGVGVTLATQVGEGTGEVVATRPLLVRPVTPRFFVVGDRVELAALVSNNTDAALAVSVGLQAGGLLLTTPAEQAVSVPAHGEGRVTWSVVASEAAYADLVFVATAGDYVDAARPRLATGPEGTIPILRYTTPETVGTAGVLDASGARVELIMLPAGAEQERGGLTIRLDPSLAAAMTDGLDYLEHFEYECTEQTVSRFLPNVLTYKALKDLGIRDAELESRLPVLVDEGLGKLYSQQHDDGGWGWWTLDESDPNLSAYVLLGLLKARAAGFEVRGDVLARGLDYLAARPVAAEQLSESYAANRQAFMLYVLAEAGRADGARLQDLYDYRAKLGRFGQAYLALAIGLGNVKDERVATLLADLSGAAVVSATGVHWEEDTVDWWSMNTNTRSTAIVLDAFARLDPDNALNPNVVRWLMVARRAGIWSTTQETAWSLIALTDWMVATGELAANYDYTVTLNGSELGGGHAGTDNLRESVTLDVAIRELLLDAANQLVLDRGEGPGMLYYTAHLEVYQPVEELAALNRGIIVTRRYTRADCADGPACPTVTSAKVGEVIRVEVTLIAPHDLYYVMLEDPLPAGAEAIDPTLATTSRLAEGPDLSAESCLGERGWCWWWNWWSRSELRDDKVVLFADALSRGTYQYTYTFRATLPGEYRVIPTVAEEMYFPEVFGRGEGQLFTIVP